MNEHFTERLLVFLTERAMEYGYEVPEGRAVYLRGSLTKVASDLSVKPSQFTKAMALLVDSGRVIAYDHRTLWVKLPLVTPKSKPAPRVSGREGDELLTPDELQRIAQTIGLRATIIVHREWRERNGHPPLI